MNDATDVRPAEGAARPASSSRRRRRRIAIGIVVALAAYAFLAGPDGLWAQARLSREIAAIRQESAEIAERNAIAKDRIAHLRTDMAYIERIARERYGMVRPGERIYRVLSVESRPPEGRR